jgi:hypothetical protein
LVQPPQCNERGSHHLQHETAAGCVRERDSLAVVEDQVFLPRRSKYMWRLRVMEIKHDFDPNESRSQTEKWTLAHLSIAL